VKNRFGIKRVYDRPGPEDGRRILVDRLCRAESYPEQQRIVEGQSRRGYEKGT
jgi:hypothetical protein